MVVRAISGIALLVILGFVLTLGGPVLFCFSLLISLIAFLELTKVMQVRTKEKQISVLEVVGLIGVVFYYGLLFFEKTREVNMLAIVLTIMAMFAAFVLTYPKINVNEIIAAIVAFVYAPVFLSYLFQTRELAMGQYLVWLIFTSSWACDTCAYCVGVTIGKHKLAPILSPKKSIEGAVGGVVGAALIGFLYAYWLVQKQLIGFSDDLLWAFPLISGVGAVLSQIGDLAASGIKRAYGIKDYGKLIPGHGGIMDRFDSVIVTAPLIYYLVVLLVE